MVLTPWEIFTVAVIGGYAALLLDRSVRLLWRALNRTAEWCLSGRQERRALKAARRQLSTFTTIDDLKE